MELSIQERLKDLRVERGLTLEQLEEQVNLSKSALGSYEAKDFKDISHYAIIKLAKFYGVTADYLLGLSQTRNHPNADLADLRLSDDMIELLKSGLIDNSLLCELAVHPDFPRLMADLEIYVNGIAGKQGCDCVAKSRKRWTVFISRQGVYESPRPSSHASTCGQRFSLDYPLAKTGGTVNGGVSSLKRRSARSAVG